MRMRRANRDEGSWAQWSTKYTEFGIWVVDRVVVGCSAVPPGVCLYLCCCPDFFWDRPFLSVPPPFPFFLLLFPHVEVHSGILFYFLFILFPFASVSALLFIGYVYQVTAAGLLGGQRCDNQSINKIGMFSIRVGALVKRAQYECDGHILVST